MSESLSFLTPYWNGREMMSIHLESFRRWYPDAPILISKTGGGADEMEEHRRRFGVQYWLEDCNYVDALLRLLQRCTTDIACITDHDTVLLNDVDDLVRGVRTGEYGLVGIEERIREPAAVDWRRHAPQYNGWMRFAPGYTDATFLIFDVKKFLARHGLRGVRGRRVSGNWDFEYHYGICQRLPRHKYLRPYHTAKYGIGNLIKDSDRPILYHQWYGSHRERLAHPSAGAWIPGLDETIALAERGEAAFVADYPNLDFADITPAWGPDWDLDAEHKAAARGYPGFFKRGLTSLRVWRQLGLRWFVGRIGARLGRWRRLLAREGPGR